MLTLDENGHVVVVKDPKEEEPEEVSTDTGENKKYEVTSDIPLVVVGDNYQEGAKIDTPRFPIFPGSEVRIPVNVLKGFEINKMDVVYNSPKHPIKDMEHIDFTLEDEPVNRKAIRFVMPDSDVHITMSVVPIQK